MLFFSLFLHFSQKNMDFNKKLLAWYLQNKREMPWRKTNNPYHIWLSEIMLQQTRVAQGLPFYEKFIAAFPTVFDLAHASEETVLKLWQGLGYYSRARNLHFTAKHIVNNFQGKFPSTYSDLLKLKGVGDYTASAIASICYNEPVAVVDGNVYRVLARYLGIDTPINSSEGNKEFKKIAMDLLDKQNAGTYNQAIMEFGALQCKPGLPDCLPCPLNNSCAALATNTITVLPVKLKKTKITKRYFNYVLFKLKNKETLIQKRTAKGIWQHLYELPLLETETALIPKDFEKLSVFQSYVAGSPYVLKKCNSTPIIHKLSHQHLYTNFYIVETEGRIHERSEQLKIPLSDLKQYPVPILISNFIEGIQL